MNKPVNKQDDPWMKPFIGQFSSMNFSVNIINHSVKYSLCLCPSSTHGAIDNFLNESSVSEAKTEAVSTEESFLFTMRHSLS